MEGEATRALLKHFLAAIAYRTLKALRSAPSSFPDFRAGRTCGRPHELVWHMTGVVGYARTLFAGGEWRPARMDGFAEEVRRFHDVLADLATIIGSGAARQEATFERLIQGPLADAMTHVGQLAMLRRLAGSPVEPENFLLDHWGQSSIILLSGPSPRTLRISVVIG